MVGQAWKGSNVLPAPETDVVRVALPCHLTKAMKKQYTISAQWFWTLVFCTALSNLLGIVALVAHLTK